MADITGYVGEEAISLPRQESGREDKMMVPQEELEQPKDRKQEAYARALVLKQQNNQITGEEIKDQLVAMGIDPGIAAAVAEIISREKQIEDDKQRHMMPPPPTATPNIDAAPVAAKNDHPVSEKLVDKIIELCVIDAINNLLTQRQQQVPANQVPAQNMVAQIVPQQNGVQVRQHSPSGQRTHGGGGSFQAPKPSAPPQSVLPDTDWQTQQSLKDLSRNILAELTFLQDSLAKALRYLEEENFTSYKHEQAHIVEAACRTHAVRGMVHRFTTNQRGQDFRRALSGFGQHSGHGSYHFR